ncbi:MAG TPA: hypothetical protein VK488_03640 [Gaiellaceae bacterium]|nr:hypothetical protein [Gaiellaceae bacterium]
MPQLLEMSPDELDTLFRESAAGAIPVGRTKGTVLVAPGTEVAWPAKKLIHWLAWRGKIFNPQRGDLLNIVSMFGVKAVRANVYKDPSWLDQAETIVLDYSKTSRIAHKVRDEIREVSPGVYLGLVYWGRNRILYFTLTSTS